MLDHNYVEIGYLIQMKIFWEISVPHFLSIVPYAAKLEKKIIREDHEIQCCITLFHNCAKNCPFCKKKCLSSGSISEKHNTDISRNFNIFAFLTSKFSHSPDFQQNVNFPTNLKHSKKHLKTC